MRNCECHSCGVHGQGKLSELRSEFDMVAYKPFMCWNTLLTQYVKESEQTELQKKREKDVLEGEGISVSSTTGSSGS